MIIRKSVLGSIRGYIISTHGWVFSSRIPFLVYRYKVEENSLTVFDFNTKKSF
jgi:hypothetical protein